MSHGTISSRGVNQSPACAASDRRWFCPFIANAVDSWYAREPGPSFIIVHSWDNYYLALPLPLTLHPQCTMRVADRFTLYFFDHDVGIDAARHASTWPGSR